MQLRKVMRFVRLRLVPLLVSGVILVSPLSLCVNAAVWEGSAEIRLDYWGVGNGIKYQMSSQTVVLPLSNSVVLNTPKNRSVCNGMYFRETATTWTGPVDVYIGGYMRSDYASDSIILSGDPYNYENYQVTYRGTDGQEGEVLGAKAEFSRFTPNDSLPHGSGITGRVSFSASEGMPISDICMKPNVECGWYKEPGGHMYNGKWVVTSFRIVSSDSSAELDQLNEVTDQLIANNQLLAAMKGDIVALLQDIYREVGDINIATDAMRTILTALVDYVDDVENGLIEINTELDNIYSMVYQQFRILIYDIQYLTGWVEYIRDDTQTIIDQLDELYSLVYGFLYESNGEMQEETNSQVQQGTQLQEGLGELQKPVYDDFDFNTNDYVDQFDSSGDSAAAVSGFLGVIFGNSMISSMLMITLSFAMVAYVLYGKR